MGKAQEAQNLFERGVKESVGDVEIMISLLRASKGQETGNSVGNATSPSASVQATSKASITSQESSRDTTSSQVRSKDSMIEVDEELLKEGLEKQQVEALVEVAARGMVQNGVGNAHIDQRIAYGNLQVNTGKLPQAVKVFSELLATAPSTLAALLGRGTAFALQGMFNEARVDFSAAIKLAPENIDALKRRAQVTSALGDEESAFTDLNRCVTLDRSADSFYQRGVSLYKMRNYKRALLDFQASARLDHGNKLTYNFMGQCHICLGEAERAIESYRKALSIDPAFREAYGNMGQAYKELANEDMALSSFKAALSIKDEANGTFYSHGFYLRGLTYFGVGLHKHAFNDFTQALKIDKNLFEAWWMRAVCASGLGLESLAVSDFDCALTLRPDHASWYQRQLALFYHKMMDTPLSQFCIDNSLSAEFKESWCKRSTPSSQLAKQPPINTNKIPDVDLNHMSASWMQTNEMKQLIDFAEQVGSWVHQSSPGFLKNRRQIAMAGFAALEMAQALRKVWNFSSNSSSKPSSTNASPSSGKSTNNKNKTSSSHSTNNQSSGKQANANNASNSKVDGKSSSKDRKPHNFGWRDMYDIVVKWRQYSEPNDPVWWVDLLPKEAFSEGFGSHTPIVTGQCKVIRYGRMFERSLPIFKKLAKEQVPFSEEVLSRVDAATSAEDLYNLRNQDYFVVTPCNSTAVPGKTMEGTRLTIQKSPPEGFEYSIRTPGTPPRWVDYDIELTFLFERLTTHAKRLNSEGSSLANKELEALKDLVSEDILSIAFYWYNFMPLARGTAACGYISILGMFLATGTHLQAKIPQNVMLDWDAILLPSPTDFIATCKDWMLPHRKTLDETAFDALPLVQDAIPTLRHLFTVLNAVCKE